MYLNEREKRPRRSHAERREATRRALLDAARTAFAGKGYAQVTIEEVVRGAGVTRGALYHHFEDKRLLLRAVVEEIEDEIDALVEVAAKEAHARSGDPLEAMMAGHYAFLDACSRPEIRRILLLDGPAILGWEEWREIDAEHAVSKIEAGLGMLVDAGLMEPQPLRALAHLLHGAAIEAALYVAASTDAAKARDEAGAGLERLMRGLCR
jgi:AcrR family transcriptional regulator